MNRGVMSKKLTNHMNFKVNVQSGVVRQTKLPLTSQNQEESEGRMPFFV